MRRPPSRRAWAVIAVGIGNDGQAESSGHPHRHGQDHRNGARENNRAATQPSHDHASQIEERMAQEEPDDRWAVKKRGSETSS